MCVSVDCNVFLCAWIPCWSVSCRHSRQEKKIVSPDNGAFLYSKCIKGAEMTNDCGLKQAESEKKMYSLEITCGWQGAPCWLSVRLNVVMWICVWCINRANVRERTERERKKQTHANIYFSIFSPEHSNRFLSSKALWFLKNWNPYFLLCIKISCFYTHYNTYIQFIHYYLLCLWNIFTCWKKEIKCKDVYFLSCIFIAIFNIMLY